MTLVTHLLFELSPFDAFWSAWFAGFCIVGMDGQVYITAAGEEYLKGKKP